MKYITLVRIPKNHLVRFHVDWSAGREWNDERKCMVSRELPFVPIDEIERELLNQLKPMQKELKEDDVYYVGQGYGILGPWPAGKPSAELPELILGADLPRSCLKWTKDLRLLFRGDKRKKRTANTYSTTS